MCVEAVSVPVCVLRLSASACADVCYIAESGRVEGKEAAVEAAQAHARELQQTVKSITSERQV